MRAVLAYHTERSGGSFVDYIGVDANVRRQGLATFLIQSLPAPVALCVRSFSGAEKAYVAMGFQDDVGREAGVGGRCMLLRSTTHPSAIPQGSLWCDLPERDRELLVQAVRSQQKTSAKGAHNILATGDATMRYLMLR